MKNRQRNSILFSLALAIIVSVCLPCSAYAMDPNCICVKDTGCVEHCAVCKSKPMDCRLVKIVDYKNGSGVHAMEALPLPPSGILEHGAYYAEGIQNVNHIFFKGEQILILTDGCVLTTNGAVMAEDIDKSDPNSHIHSQLTIYGGEKGTGKLNAKGREKEAGIQLDGANLIINGGEIHAEGGTGYDGFRVPYGGAGIGGGSGGGGGYTVINGGVVYALGGGNAAGIGGGYMGGGGTVEINGGVVTAIRGTDDHSTAGIGSGKDGGKASKFFTAADSKAIVAASSIEDQSQKNNWQGIIFEGDDGVVYGRQSWPKGLQRGFNLTVPDGALFVAEDGVNTGFRSVSFEGSGMALNKDGQLLDFKSGVFKVHTHNDKRCYPFPKGGALTESAYCLTEDVTVNAGITVSKELTVCLNGHRLIAGPAIQDSIFTVLEGGSLNICDCQAEDNEDSGITGGKADDGAAIHVLGGAARLQSGRLAGNRASGKGGAVYVESGSFSIEGGEISNNSGFDGGGVSVAPGGSFEMLGGRIHDNEAENGGGVYVRGEMEFAGGSVQDNLDNSDRPSNVYLAAGKIVEAENVAEGSSCGLSAESAAEGTELAEYPVTAAAPFTEHFFSDDAMKHIERESEKSETLVLKDGPSYKIFYEPNGGEGSMPKPQIVIGGRAELLENVFDKDGYKFVGWNSRVDGNGTMFDEGQSIIIGGDIKLYAQWKLPVNNKTLKKSVLYNKSFDLKDLFKLDPNAGEPSYFYRMGEGTGAVTRVDTTLIPNRIGDVHFDMKTAPKGEYAEGEPVSSELNILPAKPVIVFDKRSYTKDYTGGRVHVPEAEVQLYYDDVFEGKLTYTYYNTRADANKRENGTTKAPIKVGTYYVIASIDEPFGNYTTAESAIVTLSIRKGRAPETGDNSNIALYAAGMVLSAAAIAAVVITVKKKKKK